MILDKVFACDGKSSKSKSRIQERNQCGAVQNQQVANSEGWA